MKIATKMTLGFSSIALLVPFAGLIAMAPSGDALRNIGEFHTPALNAIQKIRGDSGEAIQESFAYVVSGVEQEKAEFLTWASNFESSLQQFGVTAKLNQPGEEEELELARQIGLKQVDVATHAKAMFSEYETSGSVGPVVFEQYEEAVDWFLIAMRLLEAKEQEEVEEAKALALVTIVRSRTAIYGLALFTILLAGGIGYFLARGISRSIATLTHGAERFGAGDLSVRVSIKTRDEIEDLARSFNEMAADLEVTTVSRDFLDNVMGAMDDALLVLEPDTTIRSVNNATCDLLGYDLSELVGKKADCIVQEGEEFLIAGLEEFLKSGNVRDYGIVFRSKQGDQIPMMLNASIMRDQDRKFAGVVCVSRDLRGQMQAFSDLENAHRQLDHRVKNTLAVVRSLAAETASRSADLDEFNGAFLGRLDAMVTAHETLAENRWSGLPLREAIAGVLTGETFRIALHEPDLVLPSETANPLCLALHELATNARKYGALTGKAGCVSLTTERTGTRLRLTWKESGGKPPRQPIAPGFGLTTIRGLIEHEIGGHLDMDFQPEGLVATFSVPLLAPQEEAGV